MTFFFRCRCPMLLAALALTMSGQVQSRASALPNPLFVGSLPRVATFTKPTLYIIPAAATAYDIASGDFTGTKIRDIVIADGAAGSVSLLAGRGDGTFARQRIVYSSPDKNVTAITAGDFNGDGHLDVAIVTEGSTTQDVVILLGDGHRNFRQSATASLRPMSQIAPFPFGGLRSMTVGRFTRAATLDVVVNDGVDYISVFFGDGHGGLRARHDLLADALPQSLLVADIYGNGLSDIAFIDNDYPSVYTIASHGDGTFGPRRLEKLGYLPVNANPVSIAGGDLRHLGRTDLFAVYSYTDPNECGFGRLLLSSGPGMYEKAKDVNDVGCVSLPSVGAIADFNGDSNLDLAAVGQSFPRQNDLVVLPGNGDGTFSTAAETFLKIRTGFEVRVADKLIVDDFNGDGKPDVAVAIDRTPGEGVEVLLNTTK